MFFKAKANVHDGEKARIEYHVQQIAECLGAEAMTGPVIGVADLIEWSEAGTNPQNVLQEVARHLKTDGDQLSLRIEPRDMASNTCSSGGCGGGACSGLEGLPGGYDPETRTVVLGTEPNEEIEISTAVLIYGAVCDALSKHNSMYAKFPELVDLACIVTGLGMARSNLHLVSKTALFWDSTQWNNVARPFLGYPGVAYANALAAWSRDDAATLWAKELVAEVRTPMAKSLKFLTRTEDSFYNPKTTPSSSLQHDSERWWRLLDSSSASTQIIALRHLDLSSGLSQQHEQRVLECLRSRNRDIVLHTVDSVQKMTPGPEITEQLRELVNDRDAEVQSKSLCVATKLGVLDGRTLDNATEMLETGCRHNVFAALVALASQESLTDPQLEAADRTLKRSLSACDYEFVQLLTSAYRSWVPDPISHVSELLDGDPDQLTIALEAINGVPGQVVNIDQDVIDKDVA